jgi:chromosome segregation ATPase
VNGKAALETRLADGDRLTIASIELVVHWPVSPVSGIAAGSVAAPVSDEAAVPLESQERELAARQARLDEQTKELETDRVLWYTRREAMERESCQLREEQESLTVLREELLQREHTLTGQREELRAQVLRQQQEWDQQRQALAEQEQHLARELAEVGSGRQELAAARQQLHDRYRERRDRVAGLEEAVRRAAAKVQDRKRQLDADTAEAAQTRQRDSAQRAALDARSREIEQDRERFERECRTREARDQDAERQLAERSMQLNEREEKLVETEKLLEEQQAQYRADMLRLDRWAAALEERQQQQHDRAQEIDQRYADLQRDTQELVEQGQQLKDWDAQLGTEAEQGARASADLEARSAKVAEKAAALEVQQAAVAVLHARLERLQAELEREETALREQRAQQAQTGAELQRQADQADQRNQDLDRREQQCAEDLGRLEADRAETARATLQVQELQERLTKEAEELRQRSAELDNVALQHAEQSPQLQARFVELAELQERLNAERQNLREREAALAQAEIARATLQDQLRRRADELTERQRALAEKDKQQADAEARLQAFQIDVEGRSSDQEHRRVELERRETELHHRVQRLRACGRALGQARKTWAIRRRDWEAERADAQVGVQHARAMLDALKVEARTLEQQMPAWDAAAQTVEETLARARQQLRGHLTELHAYVRQSQHELETLRSQVQAEGEQVRTRALALQQARDEHRLAVAAFRQQLIDWQAQVAAMRQVLTDDEGRLERRQAEVDAQARQVDATSARLALEAEQLQAQQREVSDRRSLMEQHLADMREWYRRKLRDLTERFNGGSSTTDSNAAAAGATPEREAATPTPAILALTGETDAGDRRLGAILRELELVDADTLDRLLVEARKQRQSLRQVLLSSGTITLYQMALIEAGNLDSLVLGPVRVLDRLRVTARETVYRVFDPRPESDNAGTGSRQALLRHLAEAEMQDAVHPDEFRQRFAAAARVQHPQVGASREILEINGRPAVLQEWVTGLASTDWPNLAGVSGVWYRLLGQAAVALHAVHQAGLVHGHLHPSLFILTASGTLKMCGLGEPLWLLTPDIEGPTTGSDLGPGDDLAALGRVAGGWAALSSTRRKGAKAKALAEPLQAILERLLVQTPAERYPSAGALLQDLERAGREVPSNAEAWERLLRQVRASSGDQGLRQSA